MYMLELTERELINYNGRNKKEIYVAYEGKIYDVSESRFWKTGLHYEHWAGQDLTDELKNNAPHSIELLFKFPIVGKLKKK